MHKRARNRPQWSLPHIYIYIIHVKYTGGWIKLHTGKVLLPTPITSNQSTLFPKSLKQSTNRSRDAARSLFWEGNKLLTGERLLSLEETNAYRRQKWVALQGETNVLALPKIGLKAVEGEINRFPPKTNFSLWKSKFQGSKQAFSPNVGLKLETQNNLYIVVHLYIYIYDVCMYVYIYIYLFILLYYIIPYCIILYHIILYYIILYIIILYCIILYYIILYHIILYYIILYYFYCNVLSYITLHYIILRYITLYYIIFYSTLFCYIILYYIILYYVILYCIVLYCIILHCIIIYCSLW